jgi:hypothetical protein
MLNREESKRSADHLALNYVLSNERMERPGIRSALPDKDDFLRRCSAPPVMMNSQARTVAGAHRPLWCTERSPQIYGVLAGITLG